MDINWVYLVLLGIAGVLLLMDAFSESSRGRTVVKLLPLALFFWLLVVFIQVAKQL